MQFCWEEEIPSLLILDIITYIQFWTWYLNTRKNAKWLPYKNVVENQEKDGWRSASWWMMIGRSFGWMNGWDGHWEWRTHQRRRRCCWLTWFEWAQSLHVQCKLRTLFALVVLDRAYIYRRFDSTLNGIRQEMNGRFQCHHQVMARVLVCSKTDQDKGCCPKTSSIPQSPINWIDGFECQSIAPLQAHQIRVSNA